MSSLILATKLYIPKPRPKAVLRPRLIARLNEGLHGKLTLISAAPGSGKTTLVSEWVTGGERPAAWLSLDEGDNAPTRFLTCLVAALQTIRPTLGSGALGLLQSVQPLPTEAILTALLNEINAISINFILVLDDYHLINSKVIDDILAFLIENLPPQLHLVITTREDPPLPLARLRARGELTELRAADLRFTPSEVADFLKQTMALTLSDEEIGALEIRTEGWIAGLQLAALSMQGREDVDQFINAFAGDNRYIVDYLVEEVLQRQPERVRRFLLQTSILDRLSGPLCDAVTGQNNGTALLDDLERGNLFVLPLDDTRHWFRYHRLFADVLAAHVLQEQPADVPVLHQRASAWYAENGLPVDAIRHALACKDFARAATLIELTVPAMRQSRQEATMRGWLKALPDALLRSRPVLSVYYAGALLLDGELEGVEARLRDAEQWLDARLETSLIDMVVVDEAEFRGLPGSIALYRAASALAVGDIAGTMKYARMVLDLAEADDHLRRGPAAGLLGLAYWTNGDLEAAHRWYAECMERLQRVAFISDAIGCAIALADIRIAQGRLREAMSIFVRGLRLATVPGVPALRGAADMHVGMSALCLEFGDLDAAMQHLLQSKALGAFNGLPQNPYRECVATALIRAAQGDQASALDLLHEAQRLYVSDFFPNVRPVVALVARVWITQGRLNEAFAWAREQGLLAGDEMRYLREFEHITLARLLLAQGRTDRAGASSIALTDFLARLLQAAEAGGRMRSVIEVLVLQALTHQAQGDVPAALVALRRALALAEPQGYVRMFVDEGPSMAALLNEAAKGEIALGYVRRLLAAFGKVGDSVPVHQVLMESLSEREREVLRLLRTELSGPELAHELNVSLNTLRTHTKNIYAKLGVNNRRAAIRRAEELKLL